MNKPSIMKTITRTAPLALLAVTMSGTAFAGKPDPQASINAYNKCYYSPTDENGYANPSLVVDVRVKNTSDDDLVNAKLSKLVVQGTKRAKGKPGSLGPKNTMEFNPGKQIDNYDKFVSVHKEYIDICSALDDKEKYMDVSLNADIELTIDNSRNGTFSGRCDDDPKTNCYDSETGEYYVCELYDESIVEITASSCL